MVVLSSPSISVMFNSAAKRYAFSNLRSPILALSFGGTLRPAPPGLEAVPMTEPCPLTTDPAAVPLR